jgi:hypothetical protein
VAAAAAALLTVSIKPVTTHHRVAGPIPPARMMPAVEQLPDDASQELFPELSSDGSDDGQASLEDDVLSLEGAGLFGNIDG